MLTNTVDTRVGYVLRYRLLAAIFVTAATAAAADTKNGFDVSAALVPADQIHWGGVRRDGIPSIDDPTFVKADDDRFLRDGSRILGVERNGIAKAYPIGILDFHEVVNDRFAGDTVVVTYCPLCYSGMAFLANTEQSRLTFGVSGLLYNSDVLLYDRETGSLWSQLMAKAISGPLKGASIPAIPAAHTTWQDWRERHPDTLVLSPGTGFRRNYRSSPYRDYQRSGSLMFPVANRNREFPNKELVLGINLGGIAKAYPFSELGKHGRGSFDDEIGGRMIAVQWQERDNYAAIRSASGEELPSVIVYWFAWYAFHPNTEVFRATD